MAENMVFGLQNGILRLKKNVFLKKSSLGIVYCQNVFGYTLQQFWAHFVLFHRHFIRFWGKLLKKLRLGATLEARF